MTPLDAIQAARSDEQMRGFVYRRVHERDSWDVPAERRPPMLVTSHLCPGCGGRPTGNGDLPSYCTPCAYLVRKSDTTERATDYPTEREFRRTRIPPQHPAAGAIVRTHGSEQRSIPVERDGARATAAVPPSRGGRES